MSYFEARQSAFEGRYKSCDNIVERYVKREPVLIHVLREFSAIELKKIKRCKKVNQLLGSYEILTWELGRCQMWCVVWAMSVTNDEELKR